MKSRYAADVLFGGTVTVILTVTKQLLISHGLTTLFRAIGLIAIAGVCGASPIFPSLGSAANYAVLGLQGTKINNSNVTITGNEGVSEGGALTNMAPSTVNGNVVEYSNSPAPQYSGAGALNGSLLTNSGTLTQNDTDALNAYNQALTLALTPTQTFAGIGNATTVIGNGGLNVIDINGSISKSLILNGTANDLFVVDVTGTLTLSGSDLLGIAGGVTSNNVLYVFSGASGTITSHVGNSFYGTLLAPNYSFNLDGTFNGEIIGGGQSIALLSGATVKQPVTPASTPEPSTIGLLGSGLIAVGVGASRRKNRSKAAPII